MNKREIALAKKQLGAHKVRVESKISKEIIKLNKTYSQPSLPNFTIAEKSNSSHNSADNSVPENTFLPEISISSPKQKFDTGLLSPLDYQVLRGSKNDPNNKLIEELSKRSLTAKTNFRKLQSTVKKEIDNQLAMSHDGLPTGFSRAQTAQASSTNDFNFNISDFNLNENNLFMPIKTILRKDGASLSDVYESKKQDTWGKIIKAQYIEDEYMKKQKKIDRMKYEEDFGVKIKQQLKDNEVRRKLGNDDDEKLAKIQYESSKKFEDIQIKKKQDAINRQKQFIAHALEDIETKRVQRQRDLIEEITTSTIMVNKAKALIALEEKQKQESKAYHKNYQDQVYKDNLIRLEKKEKERQFNFAEDRRTIAESEAQYIKTMTRKEKENFDRLNKASEGPAHKLYETIIDHKGKNDNDFYSTHINKPDTLYTQLQKSEDFAASRSKSIGQDMTAEFIKLNELKAKKKLEDEILTIKVNKEQKAILAKQEQEDISNYQKKKAYHLKYQQDLDRQLGIVKQRSLDALQKTMTEEELKYNSQLIKKSEKFLGMKQ